MLGYFVALNEMFCTALGRTHPLGPEPAGGSGCGSSPLPASPGFAHGHGSDSQ